MYKIPTIDDRIEKVRDLHQKEYASIADSVWDRDPRCDHDGMAWPCPTIQAVGEDDE